MLGQPVFLQGVWSQPFLPFRRAISAWAGLLMRFSPGSILTLERIGNKIPRFSMYFAYFPGKKEILPESGQKEQSPESRTGQIRPGGKT